MTQEPLSNCCYAPLLPEGSGTSQICTACGELADPATDVAKDSFDPGTRYHCKWCRATTDHPSWRCPVKAAKFEANQHQL